MIPTVSLVIPLYNEEKVFHLLLERLQQLRQGLPYAVEVILVDDGSRDATPFLMREVALQDASYKAVFLSRNFGHQLAVSAGMAYVAAQKAVMILDGDLQDPPELIHRFYEKILEGYEVVYAIRKKRKENIIKRTAYWLFYRLLNSISNIDIPLDSGDFCMISRRVNDLIVAMPERSRFLRGMRTWLGFKQIGIPYERDARQAGEAKYNLKMLFRLAYDGIYNFSEVPLRFITKLGVLSISLSLIYLLIVIILKISGADIPPGFTTLMVAISLFSGVQLVSLGIIGEYVARTYMQVKGRPPFVVREVIANQKEEQVYE